MENWNASAKGAAKLRLSTTCQPESRYRSMKSQVKQNALRCAPDRFEWLMTIRNALMIMRAIK